MNYKKELDKVMGKQEFVHRGCIVRVLVGGYEVLGQKVKSFEEVEEIIDGAIGKLEKSVTKRTETR